MSGPNDPYDPKEVAALQPDQLAGVVDDGRAAFAAAATLDELAAADTAHLGGRSPVALARRELGALPPQARADAGRRVNETLQALQAAYDDRRAALGRDRAERVRAEERVAVTFPGARPPGGGRHPLTLVQE